MKSKLFFIGLLLFAALNGCNKDNGQTSLAKITDFTNSECKNGTRSTSLETLRLKAIDKFKLQATHRNAMFNCCPGKLSAACKIEGQIISITEQESEQGCKCVCPYDLSYQIAPLEQGAYKLRIDGYEPVDFLFSQDLDIEVELKKIKTP